MEKNNARSIYIKPILNPIRKTLPSGEKLIPDTLAVSQNSLGKESQATPPSYRSGYVTGFSQALRLVEYLLSRGYQLETVLQHLNQMLEQDIKPWQKGEKKDIT